MTNTDKKYKCHHCKIVLSGGALTNGVCPQCNSGSNLEEMCPNDTIHCDHDIIEGIAYCGICGEAMCPICKSHDVEALSRITGYISSVGGWNSGKKQELKDRTKVTNAELLNK